jgi:hypothetical protein
MSSYIQFTKATEVESIERFFNSRNGNPRYRIRFTNGIEGDTAIDAGWAYAIHDGMKKVTVKFHYTPKGKCVIDDMLEGRYLNRQGDTPCST